MNVFRFLISVLIWIVFWFEMIVFLPILVILSLIVPIKAFHNIIVRFFCRIITNSCMLFPKVRYLSDETRKLYPVIYVANHVSFFDLFISGTVLEGYPRGLELESHFKTPFYGWFITKFGQISINPKNRQSLLKAIKTSSDILNRKERSLFVMPEGTRTRDGKIGKFNSGAFYISFESKVPVVPVIYKNLYEHNNPTSKMVKPGVIDVIIGKPFYPGDFSSREEMQEIVREYMVNVMENKISI